MTLRADIEKRIPLRQFRRIIDRSGAGLASMSGLALGHMSQVGEHGIEIGVG
jgi:hypothetical protein